MASPSAFVETVAEVLGPSNQGSCFKCKAERSRRRSCWWWPACRPLRTRERVVPLPVSPALYTDCLGERVGRCRKARLCRDGSTSAAS